MNRFMKRMVLTLAAAVVALSASAEYVEVVYLKNGSVIKGMVIEQVPNKTIKIKTKDDSIFVFPMAEVTKITKEEVAPAPQPAPQQYNNYNQQKGYNQQNNYNQQPQQRNNNKQQSRQQNGYNAPAQPAQQGGYNAPAQQGGYNAPAQQNGYNAPAQQGGYNPQPQQNGYNAPAQQGGYNPQAQNQDYTQAPNFAVEEEEEEYGWNNAVRYRGFLTDEFGFGAFDFNTFSTSHGVQLSDYIFLGAGLGYTYAGQEQSSRYGTQYNTYYGATLFAHVRSEIHKIFKSNVSPYAELKLGYDGTYDTGVCCLFGSGCHFYFGHSNFGASVGLVYNANGAFGLSFGCDW